MMKSILLSVASSSRSFTQNNLAQSYPDLSCILGENGKMHGIFGETLNRHKFTNKAYVGKKGKRHSHPEDGKLGYNC